MEEDDTSNCPDCQMQLLQQQNSQLPVGHSHAKVSGECKSGPVPQMQDMSSTPTSNCPDCQLQMLQQQHCSIAMDHGQESSQHLGMGGVVPKNSISGSEMTHVRGPISHWEPMMSAIPHLRNPEEDLLYCSTNRSIVSINNSCSSSMSTNVIPYSTTANTYNSLAGGKCGTNVVLGPSTPTHPPSTTSCDLLPNPNACLTPIPEGCSGYCATCAVLELPTNESYYRNPLTRHPVFPSLFYNQPPPMPGFSPIPECSPWGGCNSNEFPTYSYPSYSQQTAISDYFNNGGVVGGHVSSSLEHCSFIDANQVYPSPNLRNECPEGKQKGNDMEKSSTEVEVGEEDGEVVCNPSSSLSSEDSSTSDSESLISQKDLIVEDEDDESVSVSICNFDRNQKCLICQNTIITDCSSPHLDNILENIDEEITAEDLDITMSSADIEIGGIEDEVRCFHQKKISGNSSPMQISLDRLAQLIGISAQNLRNAHIDLNLIPMSSQEEAEEEQMVLLCCKCGKTAILADSLEKQLSNTTHLLQESYYRNVTLNFTSENGKSDERRISVDPKVGLQPASGEKVIGGEIFQTPTDKQDIYPFKVFESNLENSPEEKHVSVATQTSLSGNVIGGEDQLKIISQDSQNGPEYSCPMLNFENISIPLTKSGTITDPKTISNEFNTIMEIESYEMSDREKTAENEGENSENVHQTSMQAIQDLFNDNIELENVDKTINGMIASCAQIPMDNESTNEEIRSPPNKTDSEDVQKDNNIISNPPNTIVVSEENVKSGQMTNEKANDFMCDVCGDLFATIRSFNHHLRSHETVNGHQEPKKCTETIKKLVIGENKSTTNIAVEKNLSKRTRIEKSPMISLTNSENCSPNEFRTNGCSNKKKFTCLKCRLSFRAAEKLKKHEMKNCLEETLQCQHCERRFSKASDMKVHLRVHAGEKPFCCDVCGLCFTTKGNQVAHSRTHSNIKLFFCDVCPKGFNRKTALEYHQNRHLGIRPFLCSICNAAFYDPSNLINHKKKTHRSENDLGNSVNSKSSIPGKSISIENE